MNEIQPPPARLNVPQDMVRTSPISCGFGIGDEVIFTNEYGVKFDLKIRGFASEVHDRGRFVYVFTDAWWFPVEPSTLQHRVAATLTNPTSGGGQISQEDVK